MHRNIFLTGDLGDVKLGDLGLARIVESFDQANFVTSFVGTPNYMSPEQFGNKGYLYKSDIW